MKRTPKITPEEQTRIDAAYAAGQAAFERGVACAPALDRDFISTLTGPIGSGIEPLKAWHRGWVTASLAAPVVFEEE